MSPGSSPWLGQLPDRWTVARFAREISVNSGLVDPTEEPWASRVLVAPNHIESGTGKLLALETAREQGADSGKYTARAGQVLYSKIRPALNKVTITPQDCLCSADMYALTGRDGVVDHRFLMYWMLGRPFATYGALTSDRVKMPKINQDELAGAPWARPSLEEQRRIADYLDRETAQLDALISQQEQFIDLLRERRDSVWSEHYDTAAARGGRRPLRRVIRSIVDGPFGSSLTSAHYADSGTRVIRLGNIGVNEFKNDDLAYIPDDYAATLEAHRAVAGDVVVAGLGDEKMPLGRAAVVPDIGPAIVKADCYRVRPGPSVSSSFLAWVLSAPQSRAQFTLLARGSTRQRLNTTVAREVLVPSPSVSSQQAILDAFGAAASRIDAVIAKAQEHIALAKERRAALVTEAVTGRIDVTTMGRAS